MRNTLAALSTIAFILTFSLAARAQNTPPIADAGIDQSAFLSAAILLYGMAVDADGDLIVSWDWNIEVAPLGSSPLLLDESTQTPIFSGDVLGDYEISLVVSDGTDFSDPDIVVIHVVNNLPPESVPEANVTTGDAPLEVIFDGSQSYDPEGGALVYLWNFGDGTLPSGEVSPTHVYEFPGDYVAELLVTDDSGQQHLATILIVVTELTNAPPVASPTATPNTGTAPLTVQFMANASDPDGDPLTYSWDFGDMFSPDNGSSLPNPQHTFIMDGTYWVWLTVSDGQASVSKNLVIVVEPEVGPVIDMSIRFAKVKAKGGKSTMGTVEVKADVGLDLPNPDDTLAMYFDGINLFAAPFSDFVLASIDDDDDGDDELKVVYKYKADKLNVKLDLTEGFLRVDNNSVNLFGLDNANGVDVEFHVGNGVAVENIVLDERDQYHGNPVE